MQSPFNTVLEGFLHRIRDTLDDLVKQQIIAPVTEPTPWINLMEVVPKKNGTLRICLDPKDPNHYIQRKHYQLPTIEDIATHLDKAKMFTVLDVRSGFWHVHSFLTAHHLSYPFWLIPMAQNALWDIISTRGIPEKDAQND